LRNADAVLGRDSLNLDEIGVLVRSYDKGSGTHLGVEHRPGDIFIRIHDVESAAAERSMSHDVNAMLL